MGGRIRRMRAREVGGLLARYGFELVSQKGSHRKWRNPVSGAQVVAPMHQGRDLPLGTLKSIAAASEIPEHEWST